MDHSIHHALGETSVVEWLPLLLVIAFALVYLFAVLRLNRRGSNLDARNTFSFAVGIGLLGTALLPSMMEWAHADLRGHMVQHLLIGMFAPIFLVLGAPITLALKIMPPKVARSLMAILKSSAFKMVSHPVSGLLLNMGGMYLLYLTPLYNESLTNPYLHYIIHLHFLAAGYLFTWSIIGIDPVPNLPGLRVRISALFVSIAAHAFLSKYMYAHLYPLHSPHSDNQIRAAAKLMYYWGDLSELLLAIALFTLWYQKRGRSKPGLSRLSLNDSR